MRAPSSVRNRAILFCLARLGLRAQDVVSLRFDDIDWADGRLDASARQVPPGTHLPLPHDVGQAIVAYITRRTPSERKSPGLSAQSATVSVA